MDLVLGQRVHDVLHARGSIRRVLAVREARDQRVEGVISGARGLGVTLAQVLAGKTAKPAQIVIEVDQALQVIGIIHVRVIRMQLDEAVD